MHSLKIKLQKCYNIKGKLNNIEQVQKGYQEIDIWKVNEFNFLKLRKKLGNLQIGRVKI